MGGCCSSQQRCADAQLGKISTFVRFAMLGDLESVKRMLAKEKMDPNAQDRFGMTALHWDEFLITNMENELVGAASYTGKLVCVQGLLRAGASTEVVGRNGRNALHHACRKDHEDVVRFLVESEKMNVNAVSESKETPLHKAADLDCFLPPLIIFAGSGDTGEVRGKSIRSIEVLLQLGADSNLRNDQNRTPLEELDSNPGTVTDEVPEPIDSACVNGELAQWRHQVLSEQPGGGKLNFLSSARRSTNTSDAENTLVTNFRASIRERSSESELSSRPSSAQLLVAPSSAVVPVPPPSNLSIGHLDLANMRTSPFSRGLNLGSSARSSSSFSSSMPPASEQTQRVAVLPHSKKSLKYAGKRVIMALRVKKLLPGEEKLEIIRLLLRKHMQEQSEAQKQQQTERTSPRQLNSQTSSVNLSFPVEK